ncbi:MAG: YafY family protein [Bacillota bacterium]|nr:YafY family protein [Bacillota bacterium]
MELERMLAIIMYLSCHEKVRAKELADKYEVSVRTIYRDIDAISQAGIPIRAFQGSAGGIGIVEGYKLDKSVFSTDDMQSILAGLKGLHSINKDLKTKLLIEKLSGVASKSDYMPAGNEIIIDLSSWNKNDRLSSRITEIKRAIRERRIIKFLYFTNGKLTKRKVEPCVILFKDTSWYLYGFCLLREDFRVFKLKRLNKLEVTDETFEMREFSVDSDDLNGKFACDKDSTIVVVFDKSVEYSVNDIFGIDNYDVLEDGKLKLSFNMGINDWLLGFLLGFGDRVEVLEPVELRDKIRTIAEGITKIYNK